jgi:hypothetical protein
VRSNLIQTAFSIVITKVAVIFMAVNLLSWLADSAWFTVSEIVDGL